MKKRRAEEGDGDEESERAREHERRGREGCWGGECAREKGK